MGRGHQTRNIPKQQTILVLIYPVMDKTREPGSRLTVNRRRFLRFCRRFLEFRRRFSESHRRFTESRADDLQNLVQKIFRISQTIFKNFADRLSGHFRVFSYTDCRYAFFKISTCTVDMHFFSIYLPPGYVTHCYHEKGLDNPTWQC